MLTQEELKQHLHYHPDTGIFTRLTDRNRYKVGEICGGRNAAGYIMVRFNGHRKTAHRLAWLYMTGEWPPEGIDHINGVRDDNRFCNLREASQYLNALNTAVNKQNPLGLKGITFSKSKKKYRARSRVRGVNHTIGYFDTKEEAYAAYIEFAETNHGWFMHQSVALDAALSRISDLLMASKPICEQILSVAKHGRASKEELHFIDVLESVKSKHEAYLSLPIETTIKDATGSAG